MYQALQALIGKLVTFTILGLTTARLTLNQAISNVTCGIINCCNLIGSFDSCMSACSSSMVYHCSNYVERQAATRQFSEYLQEKRWNFDSGCGDDVVIFFSAAERQVQVYMYRITTNNIHRWNIYYLQIPNDFKISKLADSSCDQCLLNYWCKEIIIVVYTTNIFIL